MTAATDREEQLKLVLPREQNSLPFDAPASVGAPKAAPAPARSSRRAPGPPAAPARVSPRKAKPAARAAAPVPVPVPLPPLESARDEGSDPETSAPRRRLLAGAIDFSIVVGFTALVGQFAAFLLGPSRSSSSLPLALAGLLFSLAYVTMTLAVWGRTIGLWVCRLTVTSRQDSEEGGDGALADGHAVDAVDAPALRRITWAQAFERWVGDALTICGLGLPAALLWTGSSLSDRLSQSRIVGTPSGPI